MYVDDVQGMQVIWGMVQAEKEKDVEGKVRRMREWEGVRVAREEKDRLEGERLGKEGKAKGKKVREKMTALKAEKGEGKGRRSSDGGREATKHIRKGVEKQKDSRQSAANGASTNGVKVKKQVSFA